jgi:hypothetical protein
VHEVRGHRVLGRTEPILNKRVSGRRSHAFAGCARPDEGRGDDTESPGELADAVGRALSEAAAVSGGYIPDCQEAHDEPDAED